MTESIFSAYSRYYDLLYRDKNYLSEARYVANLLARWGLSEGELLEFGSGTGRHGTLLDDMGYRVHGVERSPEMVSQALTSPRFSCEIGDICSIDMGRKYDGVISLFHVVSYQTSNSDLISVFNNAAKHIKSGGVFIFDFWYSPAVYFQKPLVRIKRMEDSDVRITRIAEPEIYPNMNRVDVNYTIFANNLLNGKVELFEESHPMRHFSLPEIELLARATGFEYLMAEEFLTGAAPGVDTWGVCAVLKKV